MFTFLKIFFNLQKFQMLMKSNIPVSFVTHILDVISTNQIQSCKDLCYGCLKSFTLSISFWGELHSSSQASTALNCVYKHLSFILIYFGHLLERCIHKQLWFCFFFCFMPSWLRKDFTGTTYFPIAEETCAIAQSECVSCLMVRIWKFA